MVIEGYVAGDLQCLRIYMSERMLRSVKSNIIMGVCSAKIKEIIVIGLFITQGSSSCNAIVIFIFCENYLIQMKIHLPSMFFFVCMPV